MGRRNCSTPRRTPGGPRAGWSRSSTEARENSLMPPPVAAAAAFGIGYRTMTDGHLPFVAGLYATTRADEAAATGWPAAAQAAFLEQQHRAQPRHYRATY